MARREKGKLGTIKWNSQFYKIEGTALEYTQMTASKLAKGTMKMENFARSIARNNKYALQGLFGNAEKEFVRLARMDGINTADDVMRAIRTAYRSALYKVDKGRLLSENMKEIIEQIKTEEEIYEILQALGMSSLDFTDWTWNASLLRLESPDGTMWIKLDKNNSTDYGSMDVDYGRV